MGRIGDASAETGIPRAQARVGRQVEVAEGGRAPAAAPVVKSTGVIGASARARPLSAVLIDIAAHTLSPLERAALEGAPAGKSLASPLPPALAQKRNAVLALETEALAAAISLSKKDTGALDPHIDAIAAAVTATGMDTSRRASLDRLIAQADAETWKATSSASFGLAPSLQRGQGLAVDSDGTFYFSGNLSLSRVSPSLRQTLESKLVAIPKELRKLGANHIGGIAVAGGKIYAGIEDGPKYQHCFIARFNAKTLAFEKSFDLPKSMQKDGVPYVAVDLASGRVYTSEYSNPSKLNVFDLVDMRPLPALELSKRLHRVQAAQVRDGMLYASCDDEKKSIYKINLRTGTVMSVAELGAGPREIEGVALSDGPKGLTLHVTSVENRSESQDKRKKLFENLRSSRVHMTSFSLLVPSARAQLSAAAP